VRDILRNAVREDAAPHRIRRVIILDTSVLSAIMRRTPPRRSLRRATLATRNTRHFEGTGIAIIDPWAP